MHLNDKLFPMRFFQPVEVPESCFLHEVLLWVAFQRVPIAMHTPEDEGKEIRDSEIELNINGCTAYPDFLLRLDDKECAVAGLPLDPRYKVELEWGTCVSDDDDYDEELEREMREWRPKYEEAAEYPATRIYVALKEGKLAASGKLLPDQDAKKAIEILDAQDQCLSDLPTMAIPSKFWSLSGIDWTSNCARNGEEHYCWIRLRMDDVLTTFPPEGHSAASGVERIGAHFILNEASETPQGFVRSRGRPAYPWQAFHLEVAELLLKGNLPKKKEAGIQQLQDWFEKTYDLSVSRAAIGERLKAYYDRFIKTADRK